MPQYDTTKVTVFRLLEKPNKLWNTFCFIVDVGVKSRGDLRPSNFALPWPQRVQKSSKLRPDKPFKDSALKSCCQTWLCDNWGCRMNLDLNQSFCWAMKCPLCTITFGTRYTWSQMLFDLFEISWKVHHLWIFSSCLIVATSSKWKPEKSTLLFRDQSRPTASLFWSDSSIHADSPVCECYVSKINKDRHEWSYSRYY